MCGHYVHLSVEIFKDFWSLGICKMCMSLSVGNSVLYLETNEHVSEM